MLAEPNCRKRKCKHFWGIEWLGDDEPSERPVCKAFPQGIPPEIGYGDNDHTEPYPNDNGIQYEPA